MVLYGVLRKITASRESRRELLGDEVIKPRHIVIALSSD